MRSAGKEVERLDKIEVIFSEERFEIAGLGSGITREIDDFGWANCNKLM